MSKIIKIKQSKDWLTIFWNDGSISEAVYIWLCDNDPVNFHISSEDRVYMTHNIPLDIYPVSTEFNDKHLIIKWSNDRISKYQFKWLKHYTQVNRKPKYKQTLWDANSIITPTIEYTEYMLQNDNMHDWMKSVIEFGLGLITNSPTDEKTLMGATVSIGHIRPTNFGDDFKVISKPNAGNIAYTSLALPLHTDLTYLETVPAFQFLHCVSNESEGGLSIYADAFKIAEDFRIQHPNFFKILSETDTPRRYTDGERYCLYWGPIINLKKDGETIDYIRLSNHGSYIFDLPKEQMKPYYEAYNAFSIMAHDEKYAHSFRMSTGDIAVFDNRRMLHGRTEFYPNTGFRHLQGTYICHTEFYSKLAVLERKKAGLNWQDYNE